MKDERREGGREGDGRRMGEKEEIRRNERSLEGGMQEDSGGEAWSRERGYTSMEDICCTRLVPRCWSASAKELG